MPDGFDERANRDRDRWEQIFNGDPPGQDSAPTLPGDLDAEPVPSCAARVIVLERGEDRFLSVVLGQPVALRRRVHPAHRGPVTDADLDELAAMIRRWPSVESIGVEELSSQTQPVVEGLRERGLPAIAVPPEMVAVRAAFDMLDEPDDVPEDEPDDAPEDEPDDEPGQRGEYDELRGWTLYTRHHGFSRCIWLDYGDDVAELARAAGRCAHGRTVTVAAPPRQRQRLGGELDKLGIAWLPETRREVAPLPYRGQAARDGLAMQLSVSGVGWLDLELAIDGQTRKVTGSSAFTDAFGDLVTALRKAITYRRPTYCRWNQEPGDTHIVFVPDPDTDAIAIELWYDEDEFARDARTDQLLGRWTGPTHTLAAVAAEAVHAVLDAAGPHGISEKWCMPAPYGELDLLDAWLANYPRAPG